MRGILFSLILIIFSGCSSKYQAIKPLKTPLNLWATPEDLPPQDQLYKDAEGIQVQDYSIRIDLGNFSEVLVVGYKLERSEKTFKKIIDDIYPNAAFTKGPDIRLPKPSITFRVDITEFWKSGAEAIVAIVPNADGGLVAIAFTGNNYQNEQYVNDVISSLAFYGVPEKFISPALPDSIDVAGFKFERDPSCQWFGPRNLSCSPNGQMNWSVHHTLEGARQAIDLQIQQTLSLSKVKILRDDSVEVVFAGEKALARRIKYKVSASVLRIKSVSWILIAYYVATELNGMFVHCVGSFFEDQAYPGNLALLLYEIMEFANPVRQRVFIKNEFPAADSLANFVRKSTNISTQIQLRPAQQDAYEVVVTYGDSAKTTLMLLNLKKKAEILQDAEKFGNKISQIGDNSRNGNDIITHLEKSKAVLTYTMPEKFDQEEWLVVNNVLKYLTNQCGGIRQIDHAGFFNEDKLVFRL